MGDRRERQAHLDEIRDLRDSLSVEMRDRLEERCTDRRDRLRFALGFIDTEPRIESHWDVERNGREMRQR